MSQQRGVRSVIGLIWLGVFVALSIVALIAFNMNRIATTQSERAFSKNLQFLADSTSKSVELFFEEVVSEIILLTQVDAVREYRTKEVNLAFRGVISKHRERISHLILLDADGKVKISVSRGPELKKMEEQIEAFRLDTKKRFRVNVSKTLLSYKDYQGIGVAIPIFRKLKSPPKGPRKRGSIIFESGMVMALIGAEDLGNAFTNPIRIESSGFAWLISHDGHTLGNSESLSHLATSIYGDTGTIEHFSEEFAQARGEGTVVGWSHVDNNRRIHRVDHGNESWLVATAKINYLDRVWTVAVAAPRSEATRLLQQNFRQSTILFLVVVAILILGGSMMTRVNQRLVLAEEKAIHAIELEQKNRSLAEMNKRMDEFVAVVSHDIRSPLGVIRGFVTMIRSDPEGERYKRETSSMLRSCNRLMQLVNDILDVSRLESGKVELAYDPLVIDDLIMESVATMEFAAEAKLQQVTLDLGPATPMEGDSGKLLQVFNNLIANAIKFTPNNGSVHIAKRVEGDLVFLTVTDSGPGITEEERKTVFDKFEQIKQSQQGVEPGSGLGLTICKNLVELHGGVISVDSAPEQGAMFRIELPIKRRRTASSKEDL